MIALNLDIGDAECDSLVAAWTAFLAEYGMVLPR
jgi:hypothetical protein